MKNLHIFIAIYLQFKDYTFSKRKFDMFQKISNKEIYATKPAFLAY